MHLSHFTEASPLQLALRNNLFTKRLAEAASCCSKQMLVVVNDKVKVPLKILPFKPRHYVLIWPQYINKLF